MCVFCKIINQEIPSYKLYEDDNFYAFLDISQATLGHTLVVPKQHVSNLTELDSTLVGPLFSVTVELAKKITQSLNTQDYNIINNTGEVAGQTVFHAHVHIIPRYQKEELQIEFNTNQLTTEQLIDLQNNITKHL